MPSPSGRWAPRRRPFESIGRKRSRADPRLGRDGPRGACRSPRARGPTPAPDRRADGGGRRAAPALEAEPPPPEPPQPVPAIRRHLDVLLAAGLVERRAAGGRELF